MKKSALKRAAPMPGQKPAKAESDLGRRLREIKDRIVASGEYLFQSDEEVLEEVRQRRAGILTDYPNREANVRRLKRADRRRA